MNKIMQSGRESRWVFEKDSNATFLILEQNSLPAVVAQPYKRRANRTILHYCKMV